MTLAERIAAGTVCAVASAAVLVAVVRDWSWGWDEWWCWVALVPLLGTRGWLTWRGSAHRVHSEQGCASPVHTDDAACDTRTRAAGR